MFFCPELGSTVDREEKVRETKSSTCFLYRESHKNRKKTQKKGMNLLRLSHGHWTYKNSEYYFCLG